MIATLVKQEQQSTRCTSLTAQSRNQNISIEHVSHIIYDMHKPRIVNSKGILACRAHNLPPFYRPHLQVLGDADQAAPAAEVEQMRL